MPKGVHFLSPKKPKTVNTSDHETPAEINIINIIDTDSNEPLLTCKDERSSSSNNITKVTSPSYEQEDSSSEDAPVQSLNDPFVSHENFLQWFHTTAQQLAHDQNQQHGDTPQEIRSSLPPSTIDVTTFNLRDFVTTTAHCLVQEQSELESFV